MRVFVAGATGAIGRRLVPVLLARGHEVVAMTRSAEKAGAVRALGAEPMVADGLDRARTVDAVVRSAPEVVVHQLTALATMRNLRRFDREFAVTNRLRTEGTDNLLEGARRAGARRFVAQSYGGWTYAPHGGALKSEEDPLDPDPPRSQRHTLDAIVHLEQAVTGSRDLEGIALRYANFYGPGTGLAPDSEMLDLIRRRRFPIIGDGAGIWSFIHVDDAAAATAAAIESGTRGICNIADDHPMPVSEWLPGLARALGAPPPRRVPPWVGRLAVGEAGVSMMTRARGMTNAKAKRELGWSPVQSLVATPAAR
jgi:nucleoside-diphosphate-sugar epimerase